jgi:hypothetical protein
MLKTKISSAKFINSHLGLGIDGKAVNKMCELTQFIQSISRILSFYG